MEENQKNMNKKRVIFVIIALVCVLAFVVGGIFIYKSLSRVDNKEEVQQEEKQTIQPLLYEVTKEGSKAKVYLFGSIHMADKRAYPLPDKVMNAYHASDYLAVEYDIVASSNNVKEQLALLEKMLCAPGKSLKDYLHEDTYEMLVNYLKDNGVYSSSYEVYRPVMMYSLLFNVLGEKSKLKADKGIDNYFLKEAKKDGKNILEVESSTFQTDLLTSFSDELFDLIIKCTIMEEQSQVDSLNALYEGWLVGDTNLLAEDSDEIDFDSLDSVVDFYSEYPNLKEMLENYNKKLVYDRNESINQVVVNYLEEEKNVFVVVGAAHVVHQTGLAKTLHDLGYTVTKVAY